MQRLVDGLAQEERAGLWAKIQDKIEATVALSESEGFFERDHDYRGLGFLNLGEQAAEGEVLKARRYDMGDDSTHIFSDPEGLDFSHVSPEYEEVLEDEYVEDENEALPIGTSSEYLFTIPKGELIDFIACMIQGNRGRISPEAKKTMVQYALIPDSSQDLYAEEYYS